MIAVATHGRIPTRRVTVEGVADVDADTAVLDCALRFTGETRADLFGWTVRRYEGEGIAVVELHTD